MEANALSALSINTKQAWGLLIALIVNQNLPHQLEASQTLPVNVTLGTMEQMEPNARSAVSTSTNQAWGLLLA